MSKKKKKSSLSRKRASTHRNSNAARKTPARVSLDKAVFLHRSGDIKEAARLYREILSQTPGQPDALHMLGVACYQTGDCHAAAQHIRDAIQSNPGNADYYSNLGAVYRQLSKSSEAMDCYRKAIELKPAHAATHFNLGNLYKEMNSYREAAGCYQNAILHKPDYVEAHNNLGIVFEAAGDPVAAVRSYQNALQIKPDYVDALNNLGNTLKTLNRYPDAVSCLRQALTLKPDLTSAYINLGNIYEDMGMVIEAGNCYTAGFNATKDNALAVKSALLCPLICDSVETISDFRERMDRQITSLTRKRIQIDNPYDRISSTNFFLTYHGLNNKDLHRKIAGFYLQACQSLGWNGCQPYTNEVSHRIKIGFISKFFRDHTIGKLNLGIIKHMSRQDFEVKLFRIPGTVDGLSGQIDNAADEVIQLPSDYEAARRCIASHHPDVILYTDIGMEPMSYFLAFSRLAPVQCTTWGHPDTTGIPNIDYYISNEHAESIGALNHYSETLILLKRFLMYFIPPKENHLLVERSRFGLPEDRNLYVCLQSQFKFHPDFDAIINDILSNDPDGIFVMFKGHHDHWNRMIRDRFSSSMPHLMGRIRLLDRIPQDLFADFIKIADVILDTVHFNGGYTSLLALACGQPVVTWPGKLLSGRLTYGLYHQMGVMDCVANSRQSYVDIALELAKNRQKRNDIKERIKSNVSCLCEDLEAVRELEEFIKSKVKREIPG